MKPSQRPPIPVVPAALNAPAATGEQLAQPLGRAHGKVALEKTPATQFGRVDTFQPDFLSFDPDRVAVDDAGDTMRANAEIHRRRRRGQDQEERDRN